MKAAVRRHFIEIFKAVADACDGGEEVPQDIADAYSDALLDNNVKDFYGELIETRHVEVYGK